MKGSVPLVHLSRRWWGTLRARPLSHDELAWVRERLSDEEFRLWSTMDWRDQRHAHQVAQRFETSWRTERDSVAPEREAVAAALLHDVGKAESQLSTLERVLVTVLGGRTSRFRSYLDHETIGWEMCRRAGSSVITLDLLAGRGDPAVQELLRRSDDI